MQVVRLDVLSGIGRAVGSQYATRAVPTFMLFDGHGNAIYRQAGLLDTDKVKTLVQQVNERK
jgi:thioredoxin-related protein